MSENENASKEKPEAQTAVEASELVYLEPERLQFSRHGDALRLTITGEKTVLQVTVVRAFPLSDPNRYLSVQDGKGDEVGLIRDPGALAAENRTLVEAELSRRYLIPVIERVTACNERFGVVEWTVLTKRGERTFMTRNLREGQITPSPGRYVISDVDGNRYDIPSLQALDPVSQVWLLQYL